MKEILLIMSSAYCNPELQVEFGKIPAAYVPVNNRRLFDLQKEMMGIPEEDTYIALPDDYRGEVHQDRVILNPPDASIELAYARALHYLAYELDLSQNYRIHVLWGDTLVLKKSTTPCVGVSNTDTNFYWDRLGNRVFNGYLCFTTGSSNFLIEARRPFIYLDHTVNPLLRNTVQSLPRRFFSNDEWFDFGHNSTYWKSKSHFLSTRHFNSIQVMDNVVTKTSTVQRVAGEIGWFTSIPDSIRMYTPQVERTSSYSYKIEYLPNPSLAELYVYGNKTNEWWISTLSKVLDFVELCRQYKGQSVDPLFLGKAEIRHGASPWHSLHVDRAMKSMSTFHMPATIIHGDLCFSNILYDSRSNSIKVIDPRGLDYNDLPSIFGSSLYDLAKIYHSLFGLYDRIMAGMSLKSNPTLCRWFEREVYNRFLVTPFMLRTMTGLLFTSMVPLHMDVPGRAKRLHQRGIDILRRTSHD